MHVLTGNPSTWEMEAGPSGVQGQPWPNSESKSSQNYLRICFNNSTRCSPLTLKELSRERRENLCPATNRLRTCLSLNTPRHYSLGGGEEGASGCCHPCFLSYWTWQAQIKNAAQGKGYTWGNLTCRMTTIFSYIYSIFFFFNLNNYHDYPNWFKAVNLHNCFNMQGWCL